MNNTEKATGKRKKSSSDNSKGESAKLAKLAAEATASSVAIAAARERKRLQIQKEEEEIARRTRYFQEYGRALSADRADHKKIRKFRHIHTSELRASTRGGKTNTYKKSEKRFKNGKKTMVIYLGKRGGEYVRTKGTYVSLTKYKKMFKIKESN